MKKLELQKAIVEKHFANDFPMLEKYRSGTCGIGGYDPHIFSASYELVGLCGCNRPEENLYLPHFEFNVTTYYAADVPESLTPEKNVIRHTDNGMETKLKSKEGNLIDVTFPYLKELFQVRNLKSEDKLLTIIETKKRNKLPIDENQIRAGFTFRASSTSFGQFWGHMDINHPEAEEIIKEYLETIDRRFADYKELKEHFREKDKKGKKRWEGQNPQSKAYNSKRRKLHKAMFGDLKKILKKGDMQVIDHTETLSAIFKYYLNKALRRPH